MYNDFCIVDHQQDINASIGLTCLDGREEKTMKRFSCLTLIGAVIVLSACAKEPPHSSTTAADVFTPTPQVTESATVIPSAEPLWSYSSEELGLCFSYPPGYMRLAKSDTVEIVAPDISGTDTKAIFWLEISDAYDRTAEVIADQDLSTAAGVDVGRSTLTLGGEQAVVLDGMPGQDLQRRVYVVHQQTLYMLGFMPTRSGNQAATDQVEALFAAVTNSWAWSPCSASE